MDGNSTGEGFFGVRARGGGSQTCFFFSLQRRAYLSLFLRNKWGGASSRTTQTPSLKLPLGEGEGKWRGGRVCADFWRLKELKLPFFVLKIKKEHRLQMHRKICIFDDTSYLRYLYKSWMGFTKFVNSLPKYSVHIWCISLRNQDMDCILTMRKTVA